MGWICRGEGMGGACQSGRGGLLWWTRVGLFVRGGITMGLGGWLGLWVRREAARLLRLKIHHLRRIRPEGRKCLLFLRRGTLLRN